MLLILPSIASAAISDYASQLTGQPTTVKCERMKDLYGYTLQYGVDEVSTFDSTIYLSPEVCFALKNLSEGRMGNAYIQANAALTLTHEAMHIRLNSANEGMINCNAMLRIDKTLRLFGAYSKRMHDLAWEAHWSSPDEYLTDPVCRAHTHEVLMMIGPKKKNGYSQAHN